MLKVRLGYQHGRKGHRYVYPKVYNFYIKDELVENVDPEENGLIITTAPNKDAKKQRVTAYLLDIPENVEGGEGYKLLGDDTKVIKLKNEQKAALEKYKKEHDLW